MSGDRRMEGIMRWHSVIFAMSQTVTLVMDCDGRWQSVTLNSSPTVTTVMNGDWKKREIWSSDHRWSKTVTRDTSDSLWWKNSHSTSPSFDLVMKLKSRVRKCHQKSRRWRNLAVRDIYGSGSVSQKWVLVVSGLRRELCISLHQKMNDEKFW